MNFLSRLFTTQKRHRQTNPVPLPDDSVITTTMARAKRENLAASADLVEASRKQERDANFARHVIEEVLARADNLKGKRNVGLQE